MTADNPSLRANGMLVLLGRGAGAPSAGETRSEDECEARAGNRCCREPNDRNQAIAIMENAGSQRV